MEYRSLERRRSPRVEPANGLMVMRPVSMVVQMLDLSPSGMLMACAHPPRLGASMRVTAQIAGRRLDANLDIRHVSSQWDKQINGYRVGGRFVSIDPMARSVIADVLGEGKS